MRSIVFRFQKKTFLTKQTNKQQQQLNTTAPKKKQINNKKNKKKQQKNNNGQSKSKFILFQNILTLCIFLLCQTPRQDVDSRQAMAFNIRKIYGMILEVCYFEINFLNK
jgi:hypothetical protein